MTKLEASIPRTEEDIAFEPNEMGKLLEAVILKDTGRERRVRKTFPPSGVGYGSGNCPRRWFYEFTRAWVKADEENALGQINMKYGIEAHARIQEQFEKSGILIEAERAIESLDPPIKGFVDLIVDWKDQETVGEIKTTKQEAWTILRATGKPRGYQLIQLLMYMRILDKQQGFFLYENRNTGEMLILPVYMNEENEKLIEYVFDWMRSVLKLVEDETLPKRPFRKSQECKFCPFLEYCWSTDEDGTVEAKPLVVPA